MPTIKVAKAFNLLTATNAKPHRFEVGEHEVTQDVADHWYVQQHLFKPEPVAPAFDPETASRDELSGWLQARFSEHLAGLSDEDLREVAVRRHRQADEADEELPREPAAPASESDGRTSQPTGGEDESSKRESGDHAVQAAAARKAEIREQLKAMGADLPHHNASLEKHEAALAAALEKAAANAAGETQSA